MEFENEITFTPNVLYEYMEAQSGKASKFWSIIMIIGFAILAISGLIIKNLTFFLMMLILPIVILVVVNFSTHFLLNKIYKKRFMNHGEPIKKTTTFMKNIHILTTSNQESFYEYRQITKIYETEHLLILKMGIKGILLDKSDFTSGNLETFRSFIKKKCPSAQYSYR